jgi:hypothetical protein
MCIFETHFVGSGTKFAGSKSRTETSAPAAVFSGYTASDNCLTRFDLTANRIRIISQVPAHGFAWKRLTNLASRLSQAEEPVTRREGKDDLLLSVDDTRRLGNTGPKHH